MKPENARALWFGMCVTKVAESYGLTQFGLAMRSLDIVEDPREDEDRKNAAAFLSHWAFGVESADKFYLALWNDLCNEEVSGVLSQVCRVHGLQTYLCLIGNTDNEDAQFRKNAASWLRSFADSLRSNQTKETEDE